MAHGYWLLPVRSFLPTKGHRAPDFRLWALCRALAAHKPSCVLGGRFDAVAHADAPPLERPFL
jgi:hypothetical protein